MSASDGNDAEPEAALSTQEQQRRISCFLVPAQLCSASSYIVTVLSLPFAVNYVYNGHRDTPTARSQRAYSYIIIVFRLFTFLTSRATGLLSNAYGRRPLLAAGMAGYLACAVCVFGAVVGNAVWPFYVGAVALGVVSPLGPFYLAAASDLASRSLVSRFYLQLTGIGGIGGILLGMAILAVVIGSGGASGARDDGGLRWAYVVGAALALAGFGIVRAFPESLGRAARTAFVARNAMLPCARDVAFVWRNGYIFCIWITYAAAQFALGGLEAVIFNWFMLRFGDDCRAVTAVADARGERKHFYCRGAGSCAATHLLAHIAAGGGGQGSAPTPRANDEGWVVGVESAGMSIAGFDVAANGTTASCVLGIATGPAPSIARPVAVPRCANGVCPSSTRDVTSAFTLFWSSCALLAALLGTACLGPRLVRSIGVKRSFVFATCMSAVHAVILSLVRDPIWAFANLLFQMLQGPSAPLNVSLLMGQVRPEQRGDMAALMKTTDALGKSVGAAVLGAWLFAQQLEADPELDGRDGWVGRIIIVLAAVHLMGVLLPFGVAEHRYLQHDLGLYAYVEGDDGDGTVASASASVGEGQGKDIRKQGDGSVTVVTRRGHDEGIV